MIKKVSGMQWICIAIMLLSFLVIVLLLQNVWLGGMSFVVFACSMILFVRKAGQAQSQTYHQNLKVMEAQSNELFIRTLRLKRHDWMNDIQLLYGYLKLKKYDKMQEYVEYIKEQNARESTLFQLGIPRLIVFLCSFQADCRELDFKVEVEHEVNLDALNMDKDSVTNFVISLLMLFKQCSVGSIGESNVLTLEMDSGAKQTVLCFDFHGRHNHDMFEAGIGKIMSDPLAEALDMERDKGKNWISLTVKIH